MTIASSSRNILVEHAFTGDIILPTGEILSVDKIYLINWRDDLTYRTIARIPAYISQALSRAKTIKTGISTTQKILEDNDVFLFLKLLEYE